MPAITLNESQSRFETTVHGITAYVTFERPSSSVIAYTHTIVPEALSGQGIASALAKHVLEYAVQNQLKVQPDCPYIRAYIGKHPEYQSLVV